jgi:DNA mismatch repair protein PMS2
MEDDEEREDTGDAEAQHLFGRPHLLLDSPANSSRQDTHVPPTAPVSPRSSSPAPGAQDPPIICRQGRRSLVLVMESPASDSAPPSRRHSGISGSRRSSLALAKRISREDGEDNEDAGDEDIVMSTQGASWTRRPSSPPPNARRERSLSPDSADVPRPPAKRLLTEDAGRAAKKAKLVQQTLAKSGGFKLRLAGFASQAGMPASQLIRRRSSPDLGVDEEPEDDAVEENDVPTDAALDTSGAEEVAKQEPSSPRRAPGSSSVIDLSLDDDGIVPMDKPRDLPSSDDVIMLDASATSQRFNASPITLAGTLSRDAEDNDELTIAFDEAHVQRIWSRLSHPPASSADSAPSSTAPADLRAADVSAAAAQAEAALSRTLAKTDFARMIVAGQFNRGFIVARRCAGGQDDLFIVDQHAADEKYNFELLQRTTRIESQRLVRCVAVCFSNHEDSH